MAALPRALIVVTLGACVSSGEPTMDVPRSGDERAVPVDSGPAYADVSALQGDTPTLRDTPSVDGGLASTPDALSEDRAPPSADRGATPMDAGDPCARLRALPDLTFCAARGDQCTAVFTASQGCAALCAAAGLQCVAVHENLDGACGPDLSRPALRCDVPSMHGSDHCTCARPGAACTPRCGGAACGDDGCGGACGACATGQRCDAGRCVTIATPMEDCARYPFSATALLADRVGFGARATGGDPARVYRVTTLDGGSTGAGASGSLRRALESDTPWWIVFDVNGTITFRERVRVRSNRTVDGRGRDIHIRGHVEVRDARNVILTDLRLSNDLEGHCTQAGDVLTLSGLGTSDPAAFTTRDIWLHHLEVFNGGDGLLDIRGASGVTVSWTHFHTHKKGILLWGDRDNRPTPGMRLTFHHNFFDRITLRGPQLVYGWAHYFNNFQYQWFEYGAGSLGGAQLYSEGNVYEARNACVPSCRDTNPCGDTEWFADMTRALVTEWDTNGTGYTRSSGDLLRNGARLSIVNPDRVFDPRRSYAYTADPASDELARRVREGAGPRPRYCR